METLIRLEGMQEMILNKLMEMGFYKTKSEAIRAAVLGLGKEYKVIQELEDELVIKKLQKIDKEIKEGKRKLVSFEEVAKQYGFD